MKFTATSKTALAKKYKVHYTTFKKWLELIPNLNMNPNIRTLTPRQVELIYTHLGEP
jgi:hypothetical protein